SRWASRPTRRVSADTKLSYSTNICVLHHRLDRAPMYGRRLTASIWIRSIYTSFSQDRSDTRCVFQKSAMTPPKAHLILSPRVSHTTEIPNSLFNMTATPNQAMQRTASKPAIYLLCVYHPPPTASHALQVSRSLILCLVRCEQPFRK